MKDLLKLKLEEKKFFSFPVYHQTKLTGEIKIKIEALSKEEEFIPENSKYLEKCISRTTVSTHMKPILSRKDIPISKANIQFPRKSMEMEANVEEQNELFQKFEMINRIYK